MPAGIYTQTVCLLLRDELSLDPLQQALGDYVIRRRVPASENWAFGGDTLVIDYRPEVNGYVAVDVVNKPWPDGMGDPKDDALVFGAWGMSAFGPATFPGGLQRAMQQCWAWEAGRTLPAEHRGFVRVRSSYVFGASSNSLVRPPDYDAEQDLEFVTKVAASLLPLPQALCYFNPGGEVLRSAEMVVENIEYAANHELPTLELWSNVRLFNIDDSWSLMDTVGNSQLDLPDIEAVFSRKYDPGEVDGFLRNLTLYLLNEGEILKAGDTTDGPGDVRWQVHLFENGLVDPPRKVLCFVPQDGKQPPEAALKRGL